MYKVNNKSKKSRGRSLLAKGYGLVKARYSNPQNIVRDVQFLKSVLNPENGVFHYNASTTIGTGGSVLTPFLIPQGNNVGERQGNSVKLSFVRVRYSIRCNAAAQNTFFRIIVAFDKDRNANTNTPTITDILDTADPLSFYVINTQILDPRFHIVYDRVHSLSQISDTNAVGDFSTSPEVHCKFVGTGSTSASTGGNTPSIFIISSESVNLPTYNLFSEIRYYDN